MPVQNHLQWEEVGRDNWVGGLKKPLKTQKTRQLNQGSVELFLSLPFNFVVGFPAILLLIYSLVPFYFCFSPQSNYFLFLLFICSKLSE